MQFFTFRKTRNCHLLMKFYFFNWQHTLHFLPLAVPSNFFKTGNAFFIFLSGNTIHFFEQVSGFTLFIWQHNRILSTGWFYFIGWQHTSIFSTGNAFSIFQLATQCYFFIWQLNLIFQLATHFHFSGNTMLFFIWQPISFLTGNTI